MYRLNPGTPVWARHPEKGWVWGYTNTTTVFQACLHTLDFGDGTKAALFFHEKCGWFVLVDTRLLDMLW